MSKRIQPDWLVLDSLEDPSSHFCIDYFLRPDDTLGYEVFRRSAEDQGLWEPLSHYSVLSFADLKSCVQDSLTRFDWLGQRFIDAESLQSYVRHITTKIS